MVEGRKRYGSKEEAFRPQIAGLVCVIPLGNWITEGDLRWYASFNVVEVRVVGWVTVRTDVAASTKRRVSWKVDRRRGQ